LRQSEESIGELLDQLEKLDLTKSERLQLINTAPTTLVELHVVRTLPLPSFLSRDNADGNHSLARSKF